MTTEMSIVSALMMGLLFAVIMLARSIEMVKARYQIIDNELKWTREALDRTEQYNDRALKVVQSMVIELSMLNARLKPSAVKKLAAPAKKSTTPRKKVAKETTKNETKDTDHGPSGLGQDNTSEGAPSSAEGRVVQCG